MMALESYQVFFLVVFAIMWMAFLLPSPVVYILYIVARIRSGLHRAQSAHRATTTAAWLTWFTWPAFLRATVENNNSPTLQPSTPAAASPEPSNVLAKNRPTGDEFYILSKSVRVPARPGARRYLHTSQYSWTPNTAPLFAPHRPSSSRFHGQNNGADLVGVPSSTSAHRELAAAASFSSGTTQTSTSVHRSSAPASSSSYPYSYRPSTYSTPQSTSPPGARMSKDGSNIVLVPFHPLQASSGPDIAPEAPASSPTSHLSTGAGYFAPTDPNDDSSPKTHSEMLALPIESQREFQTWYSENGIGRSLSSAERVVANRAYAILSRTQKETNAGSETHAYSRTEIEQAMKDLGKYMKIEKTRAEQLRLANIFPDQDVSDVDMEIDASQLPPLPDPAENTFDMAAVPSGLDLDDWLQHPSKPDQPQDVPLVVPGAEQSDTEDAKRFIRETPPPEDLWNGEVRHPAPRALKRKASNGNSTLGIDEDDIRPKKKVRFLLKSLNEGKWIDRQAVLLNFGDHTHPDLTATEVRIYLIERAIRLLTRRPHRSNAPRPLDFLRRHIPDFNRTDEELLHSLLTYRQFEQRRRILELRLEAAALGKLPEWIGNPAFLISDFLPDSDEIPWIVDLLQQTDDDSCAEDDADALSLLVALEDPESLDGKFKWLGPERADRRQLRAAYWRPVFYTELIKLLRRFGLQHGDDDELIELLRKLGREFWIHQVGERPSVYTGWSDEGLPNIPADAPEFVSWEAQLRDKELEAEDATDGNLDLDRVLGPLRNFLEKEAADLADHPEARREIFERWTRLWHEEYKPRFLEELNALDHVDQYELTGHKEDRIHYGALRRAALDDRIDEQFPVGVAEAAAPAEHPADVLALVKDGNAEALALGLALSYGQQRAASRASQPALATPTGTTTANAAMHEAAATHSKLVTPVSPSQAALEDTDSVDALALSPAASSAGDAAAGLGPATRTSTPFGEQMYEDTDQSGMRAPRLTFPTSSIGYVLPTRGRSLSPCRPSPPAAVPVAPSVLGRRPRSPSPSPVRIFKRARLGTPFPERFPSPEPASASASTSTAHMQPAGSPPAETVAETAAAPARRRRHGTAAPTVPTAPVEPSRRSGRTASKSAAAAISTQVQPARRTRNTRGSSVAGSDTVAGPSTTVAEVGRKRKA